MKKIFKSSLSVFLAIAIIFGSAYVGLSNLDFKGVFTVKAKAASESDLTFALSEDGTYYSVTGCNTSASGEIIIPDTYSDLPVKSIGELAFYQCEYITSVKIPDNVTSIGFGAFAYCTELSSITIPYGVKELNHTFLGCGNLADVTLPDSVEILVSAFSECTSLTDITIPDSVTDISGAFMNCTSLTSVVIPGSVQNTEDAFIDCESLTSVIISEGVKNIGSYTFDKCKNLAEVTIPLSVTDIGAYAFRYKSVCVFFAGSEADWGNIVIGENNEGLANGAVHYNSESHKYSDKWTIDAVPTYYEDGSKSRHCLYCDAKIDVTVIPRIVINDIMYMDTKGLLCDGEITYILKLKAGTTVSGSVFGAVFDPDVLEVVEGKNGACTTTDNTGYERNNYSGLFVTGMKHNTDDTFVVAHMDINDSVFSRDTEYIKFTFKIKDFSQSQTSVDFYCFEFVGDESTSAKDCNILLSQFNITIKESTDHNYTWEYDYENKTKTKKCSACGDEVTEALLITDVLTFALNSDGNSYTVTDCVSEYVGSVEIPEAYKGLPVTAIGTDAFRDCTKITSVVIPDSVTAIGGSAFRNCTSLTSIKLSDNITGIPGAMCFGCAKLETIIIPDSVSNIGGYAFSGCTSLKTAVLPDSVINIGANVFTSCTALVINCSENSVAQNYADTNSIAYILNTDKTLFDVFSKILYTDVSGGNLNGIISASDSVSYTTKNSVAGTGTVIDIIKDGVLHTQYTLVVYGDTNGDSICDVLDCFDVERASNGNGDLSGVYAEAGDTNNDGVIDITDYQDVVNKALA